MAMGQHKLKVYSVVDDRELNSHVDTFIANIDICAAKLKQWCQQG